MPHNDIQRSAEFITLCAPRKVSSLSLVDFRDERHNAGARGYAGIHQRQVVACNLLDFAASFLVVPDHKYGDRSPRGIQDWSSGGITTVS